MKCLFYHSVQDLGAAPQVAPFLKLGVDMTPIVSEESVNSSF